MTYQYRTTVALILTALVFFAAACSDQNQVAPTASEKRLEQNRKRALKTGARKPSAPGSVKEAPELQREPVRVFIEDREKRQMGLLVLLLMGTAKQPLAIQ